MTSSTDTATPAKPGRVPNATAQARPKRSMGWSLPLQRLALLVIILALWEEAVDHGYADALWVSRPSAIAKTLWMFFVGGTIYPHLFTTLGNALAGLVVGSVGGVALGFFVVWFERIGRVLDPFINFINSIPRIALAPLFVLWFGIGLTSNIVTIFVIVFFLLLVNTVTGIRQVDPHLVRAMRAMGATRWQVTRYITIPSTTVWILAGLKLAIPQSVIGAVIAEYVGSQRGLGYLIEFAAANLDTTTVLSAVTVLGVVSILIRKVVDHIEERLMKWTTQ
jgi:NitT/TauT family transport system permease protein